jgi:hypothetical protein
VRSVAALMRSSASRSGRGGSSADISALRRCPRAPDRDTALTRVSWVVAHGDPRTQCRRGDLNCPLGGDGACQLVPSRPLTWGDGEQLRPSSILSDALGREVRDQLVTNSASSSSAPSTWCEDLTVARLRRERSAQRCRDRTAPRHRRTPCRFGDAHRRSQRYGILGPWPARQLSHGG